MKASTIIVGAGIVLTLLGLLTLGSWNRRLASAR